MTHTQHRSPWGIDDPVSPTTSTHQGQSLSGVIDTKDFAMKRSNRKTKSNDESREYPRANGSTLVNHQFSIEFCLLTVKVEADCHSEEGTMIIAYSVDYGSLSTTEKIFSKGCQIIAIVARITSDLSKKFVCGSIIMAANVYIITNIMLCRGTILMIGCLSLIILS